MYQGLFAVVGNKLRYWPVWRVALELNFVNHVFPSGGVSGISYFGIRLRRADITGAKSTLVQVMKLVIYFAAFEMLLVAGVFFMALGGRVNNLVMLTVGSLSTLLIVGTFAFLYIIGSERRIHVSFLAITKFLNDALRFLKLRGKRDVFNPERAESAVKEFHHNYKVIKANYRKLKGVLWWALIANATEIMSIYVVYIAFGKWVNVGSMILAYGVANFAGLVSVMPGGIGIYEALMTGVLAAAGIPAALSLPVTVMYRVFNTIIQLPLGYAFYHQSLNNMNKPEDMHVEFIGNRHEQ
jgi:uncharacterized protein (TIRG00374 family)